MTEKKMSRTWTAVIVGVIIVILAAVAGSLFLSDEMRKRSDIAYEKGFYDSSYAVLEGEWVDSRVSVVHSYFHISTCEADNANPYCQLLTTSRDILLDFDMPERAEGDETEAIRAERMEVERITAGLDRGMDRLSRYQRSFEATSLDKETIEAIDDAATDASHAYSRLDRADLRLDWDPENTAVEEAKENLATVLAEYESRSVPTAWAVSDIERAADKINTASEALNDVLDIP